MPSDLALHQTQSELAHAHERFNALAQVAGRRMTKWFHTEYMPAASTLAGGLAGAVEARFQAKGSVALVVLAGISWGVAMASGENADLRNASVSIASGFGAACAGNFAHDKVTNMMAATTAPPPVAVAA